MNKNLSYCFFFLTALVISCTSPQKDDLHETENELYTLPGLDHGLIQSPINILTSSLQDADEHEIEVTTVHSDKVTAVVNKGHTIELEFDPGKIL